MQGISFIYKATRAIILLSTSNSTHNDLEWTYLTDHHHIFPPCAVSSPNLLFTKRSYGILWFRGAYPLRLEMVFFFFSQPINLQLKYSQRPLKSSGEPIAPNELHEHCKVTKTPGPGCLCSLKYANQAPYLGSSIAPVNLSGFHNGEHAAQCSVTCCGYFGMNPSYMSLS